MKWLAESPRYAYDFEGREWCCVLKYRYTWLRRRVRWQEQSKNWFLTGRRMSPGMGFIVEFARNPGGVPHPVVTDEGSGQ